MIESISDEHLAAIARCDPSLIVGCISRFTLLDVEGITMVFDIAKNAAKNEMGMRASKTTAMTWEFFRDEGTWECFSAMHDQMDNFRWIIKVQGDGKFDLSESAEELVKGIRAFDTLAAAKAFCESSESTMLAFMPKEQS